MTKHSAEGGFLDLDLVEEAVRQAHGVLDCCVFQNPKRTDEDLFAFVVIDQRRNKQQVIESIRLDQTVVGKIGRIRIIREVAGLPSTRNASERRRICASFILEVDARNK